jgi:hypothetical protein
LGAGLDAATTPENNRTSRFARRRQGIDACIQRLSIGSHVRNRIGPIRGQRQNSIFLHHVQTVIDEVMYYDLHATQRGPSTAGVHAVFRAAVAERQSL